MASALPVSFPYAPTGKRGLPVGIRRISAQERASGPVFTALPLPLYPDTSAEMKSPAVGVNYEPRGSRFLFLGSAWAVSMG